MGTVYLAWGEATGKLLVSLLHNLFPHGVPYAGVNKSGMGGGVFSVDTLLDYWRSTSVVRPL